MAVTVYSLKILHPEWANASDDEIQNAIDEAEAAYSSSVFGDRHDEAVILGACRRLALGPFSRELRLTPSSETTIYDERLWRLVRQKTSARGRVI